MKRYALPADKPHPDSRTANTIFDVVFDLFMKSFEISCRRRAIEGNTSFHILQKIGKKLKPREMVPVQSRLRNGQGRGWTPLFLGHGYF